MEKYRELFYFIIPIKMSTFSLREKLNQMQAQREALEIEADAIASELNSVGPNGEPPAGIKTLLVDSEGFPRGDIDLFNVRNKRQRLAIINTDHKALMGEIEKTLHAYQQELPTTMTSSSSSALGVINTITTDEAGVIITVSSKAIAIVDEILDGSPAHLAGILDRDELLQFGYVTASTTDALNSIPTVVRDHVNQRINITVRRKGSLMNLELIPKTWGGRGLLGCHLSKISQM